ncbi:MAG TPA: zinc ribbon domain-containing protein [bacterium]|nr:zinc ribbon domain-containing protein [bacterium]HOL35507.1 zinc ribbon domain-containing protein [bacterium]HPP08547.1 zinc ribbon domain-containing protein [bacterium]
MPTYDYECKKCGHSYRKFQKMTDEPDKICPECKGEVRRLIGLGGGVIYKGSGFYTTDYRSPEYLKKAREESGATSTSSSSSCSCCSSKNCSTCK